MKAYLDILSRILENGVDVQTGATLVSENRKPTARSLFAAQFRHDLADGFPAVTTKRLYFDSVVKEILWFLRGETNIKTLGCKIWDQWADEKGECGPIYGKMWRRWVHADDANRMAWSDDPIMQPTAWPLDAWDQVDMLLKDLKAVVADPFNRARRRIILSGWNPPDVQYMGLPPCHTMSQWLPVNGRLNVHCFWRSIDAFTGMPFNIAQYALLNHIFADLSGLKPGVLVASITDCHVYDNQIEAVKEQLSRTPSLWAPQLVVDPDFKRMAPDLSIEQLKGVTPKVFTLLDYTYDSRPLKAEVAV